jgi:hypothetical protein
MANLENTLMKYIRRNVDIGHGIHDNNSTHHRTNINIYDISDYNSINISKILTYVENSDPSMFDWYQIEDNDKIERISLEIYGNANYWDILTIINKHNPLFEMPFDFDTLSKFATNQIDKFIDKVYKKSLSKLEYDEMYSKLVSKYVANNEMFRVIKIIKPSRMNGFLQDGHNLGIF